jgi:GNAT superfamily N-acetyltransferase
MNKPIVIPVHELKFRHGLVLQHEAMYATLAGNQFPCGFIWYAQTLRELTLIGYIFVHERCRRQGIATRMLTELRAWYPGNTVCTAIGNELSTPWLEEMGFIKEPNGWFLRPTKPEPCPMI